MCFFYVGQKCACVRNKYSRVLCYFAFWKIFWTSVRLCLSDHCLTHQQTFTVDCVSQQWQFLIMNFFNATQTKNENCDLRLTTERYTRARFSLRRRMIHFKGELRCPCNQVWTIELSNLTAAHTVSHEKISPE